MRKLAPAFTAAYSLPWICSKCLRGKRPRVSQNASYATAAKKVRSKSLKRVLFLATASGMLGAGTALAFPDDIKHTYIGVQRTGRVIRTLALCMNEWVLESRKSHRVHQSLNILTYSYRKTLNHEADSEAQYSSLLKACHKRCAERTLRALEQNGSIFIKLGQHLSSMNYLLPSEWTTTFVPLQDKCPVSSYESIEQMFIKDTGYSIASQFDEFETTPIGAASLAQVHLAKLKGSDKKVAVKVQHPALAEWVPLDLALTKFTFATLKRFFPDYDLEWLSTEMELSLPQELNFALEGQNAMRTKAHFQNIHGSPLVVPNVEWGLKRILVMEYVSGHRTDDLNYIDANGIDRDEVSAALARIFNEMIFGDTPLHCDPHGGNIAIRKNTSRREPNFDIILYDHGLYRDISKQLRRDYAKLWLAVIDADERKMRKSAFDVAGITRDQFPLFASAITGRDYTVATKSIISTRTDEEKNIVSDAMADGMLTQLVQLLGKVPRIILLILKTNDLSKRPVIQPDRSSLTVYSPQPG